MTPEQQAKIFLRVEESSHFSAEVTQGTSFPYNNNDIFFSFFNWGY